MEKASIWRRWKGKSGGCGEKAKWKMLKDARNDFIHCGIMPGPKERAILIEEVLQLEKDLEKEVVEKRLPAHA